jgi:hypothetical protein
MSISARDTVLGEGNNNIVDATRLVGIMITSHVVDCMVEFR